MGWSSPVNYKDKGECKHIEPFPHNSNREGDSSNEDSKEEDGENTESEYSEDGGCYVPSWKTKIWSRRFEQWNNKKWLTYRQNTEQLSGPTGMVQVEKNISTLATWISEQKHAVQWEGNPP